MKLSCTLQMNCMVFTCHLGSLHFSWVLTLWNFFLFSSSNDFTFCVGLGYNKWHFIHIAYRYNRGWFYHKEHRLWFMRVANMEPLVKTNAYERGSYICFDPNTWETIRKVWISFSLIFHILPYSYFKCNTNLMHTSKCRTILFSTMTCWKKDQLYRSIDS